MSWIQEIDVGEASGELRRIYEAIEKARGKVANIMKVHSLNPGAMRHHLTLYVHLMFGASGLSRSEREAIAVAVSEANRCDYCATHHGNALKETEAAEKRTGEDETVRLRRVSATNYACKLTATPATVSRADVEGLRAAGFSDRDILDIALIVAYFNFVNRVALGLGVTFSTEEAAGYVE